MISAIIASIALFFAWRWTLRARRDLPILPVWAEERLRVSRRIIAARWPTIALSAITTLEAAVLIDGLADLGAFAPFNRLASIVMCVVSCTAALVARIALADRKEIDAAAPIRLQETVPPPLPEAPQVLYQAPDAAHIEFPSGPSRRTIN
jgi:hypothetical protein